ncbi:transposase [Atopobium sp. oral taxon 416]|uniref:transposase n=1 Tax=Atopobium sp. oral taxon 416 TaxID=712157 RepID=UPI001BA757FF|nr:transposase [Atopobium sp. oral taxon 416]QUC04457.1 transposase [Atopobium sp. oral taxon 416]
MSPVKFKEEVPHDSVQIDVANPKGNLAHAWTLKEDLQGRLKARRMCSTWMRAAAYCRIAPVGGIEKKVRHRRTDIVAAVELGIGSGRVESINNKIKVVLPMGYSFKNTDNLVSLLVLRCLDLQPVMSWEDRAEEARKVEASRRRDCERSRRRRKERFSAAA